MRFSGAGNSCHNRLFSTGRTDAATGQYEIDDRRKTMSTDLRNCVICYQPLPARSKLTLASVSRSEAEQNGWGGQENSDGMMMVDMCLQCQIDRSKDQKER